MKRIHALLLLGLLVGDAIAAGTTETLTLRVRDGAPELVSTRPLSSAWKVEAPLDLVVNCEGVDCRQLSFQTAGGKKAGQAAGANGRRFVVDSIPDTGMALKILVQDAPFATIKLEPAAQQGIERQADDGGGQASTLQELLTCVYPQVDYEPYNQKGNYAEFVTNALGTVLGGPLARDGQVIDEDDTVFVKVFVHPDLMPFMRVKRVSDTRTLGTLNIAGQGQTLARQAEGDEPVARTIPMCQTFTARLTDFKAGEGKVRISAQIGNEDKELGTFAFAVSPIYHGILSFGPLTSDTVNTSFKLADSGGTNIIVPGTEGDRDVRYAVWYTHFVWGGRDLEKAPDRWYHRINPSLGIVTNDLDEHALAGVSVDFGAVVLHVGKHYAKTTVLSKASGLAVGDEFTGDEDAIPTARKWKSSTYYGVSIDLRAAAALIKAAFSGGAK